MSTTTTPTGTPTRVARTIDSPVGPLLLVGDGTALTGVYFTIHEPAPRLHPPPAPDDAGTLLEAARQLSEYFAGQRRTFDLALAPQGTDFQLRVWLALRAIPFGETRSYGAIAAAVGAPGSSRAVGAANSRNPLSIIVPCHRVIGSNGTLTGYAGGMEVKRWLLTHEGSLSEGLPL